MDWGKSPDVAHVTKLKEFICLLSSKPKETRTGICNKGNRSLFKEMAASTETQGSWCSKTWFPDGPYGIDYVGKKSLAMVAKGVGIVGSTDCWGCGRRQLVDHCIRS